MFNNRGKESKEVQESHLLEEKMLQAVYAGQLEKVLDFFLNRKCNLKVIADALDTTNQGKEFLARLVAHVMAQELEILENLVYLGKLKEICDSLDSKRVEVNHPNKSGLTLLHYAIKNNKLDIACELVKRRADIYYQNRRGETAISLAAATKNQDMIDLIQHHINILEREKQQYEGARGVMRPFFDNTRSLPVVMVDIVDQYLKPEHVSSRLGKK